MSQNASGRPRCSKCRGPYIPNRDLLTDRVESVTCANCGHTVYRNHKRRHPDLKETAVDHGKGQARPRSHKKKAAQA